MLTIYLWTLLKFLALSKESSVLTVQREKGIENKDDDTYNCRG